MIASSDPRVTYSDLQWPTVTYNDPKVTYIDPTHLIFYLSRPVISLILEIKRLPVEGRKEGGGNQI